MPLDDLISLTNDLKSRVEEHGDLLRRSEALTRYALIDPLLRVLGWDTEDPHKVVPEYQDSGTYADYALMVGTNPGALVEAKKLGEPLASGIEQALNYCNRQGINHMIVTDGDLWEMYEVFRQARIEERKLVSFSVQSDPVHEVALKALHLWQPNLGSAAPVIVPPESGIGQIRERSDSGQGRTLIAASDVPETAMVSNSRWIPLTEVRAGGGAKAPKAIRFSKGMEHPIRYWNQVLTEVADWLSREGVLTGQKCPIGRGYDRYVVHTEAKHPSGKDFFQPRRLSNGVMLETHNSALKSIDDARFLMEQVGQSAGAVELRVD